MRLASRSTSRSVRRAKGALIIDGKHIGDTLQCVHCAMHWQVVHGSGIERGFCMKCMGPSCGQKQCDPCIPFAKKLAMMEKNNNYLI